MIHKKYGFITGKRHRHSGLDLQSLPAPLAHWLIGTLICILLLVSCADSQDDTLPTAPGSGDTVELTLKLSVSQEIDATPSESALSPASRAVDDSDTSPYSQVKNVWVLQFDGQGDNAALTGVPFYIDSFDTKTDQERVCTLPSGNNQTVWFLANTFDEALVWDADLTLGQLKTRSIQIAAEADLHRRGDATATPGAGYPDDYDYYLIMNGTYEGNITATTSLQCTLYRNAVRLDFRLKNSAVSPDITIDSVQLRGVMQRQFFYNSYTLPDVFPADGQEAVRDFKPLKFDKGANEGDCTRFRFYLPANKRGVNPAIANKWEKNHLAPAGATSVRVYGHYAEEGNVVSVVYTFYPGANQTTDFNLLPDHRYTCNVEITGVGDPALDSRVQIMGPRDFAAPGEERANCYMLNPNPAGTRQFRIPVDRINLFWGGQGYENVPANTIGSSDEWTAEVLWADFTTQDANPDVTDYFKFTKATGTGTEGNKNGYFTVEAGPKTTGNVLVAVKKANSETILWSWHLWITEYNPYQGVLAGKLNAVQVPGGVYMRGTNCAMLPDGKYQGVMDRPLGSFNPSQRPPLAYQFGRKDPFCIKSDNTKLYTFPTGYYTNAEAVQNPTIAVYTTYVDPARSYWYNNTVSEWQPGQRDGNAPEAALRYDTRMEWNDPNTVYNYTEGVTKSLFDPCPPGWKVPRPTIGSWTATPNTADWINLPTDVGIVLFYGWHSGHGANYPGYTNTSWEARSGIRLRVSNAPWSVIRGQPRDLGYSGIPGINTNYPTWASSAGAGGLVPVLPQRMAH